MSKFNSTSVLYFIKRSKEISKETFQKLNMFKIKMYTLTLIIIMKYRNKEQQISYEQQTVANLLVHIYSIMSFQNFHKQQLLSSLNIIRLLNIMLFYIAFNGFIPEQLAIIASPTQVPSNCSKLGQLLPTQVVSNGFKPGQSLPT